MRVRWEACSSTRFSCFQTYAIYLRFPHHCPNLNHVSNETDMDLAFRELKNLLALQA